MKPKAKKSTTWSMYGITNRWGEPWTHRTFETEHQAESYRDNSPFTTQKHRVVPVRVTVRVLETTK